MSEHPHGGVLSCSALKRKYRDQLREHCGERLLLSEDLAALPVFMKCVLIHFLREMGESEITLRPGRPGVLVRYSPLETELLRSVPSIFTGVTDEHGEDEHAEKSTSA